nr:uncharacterized protein LOC112286871 isoform X1 [Physcomitrium patens]|eukprot:XP_024384979.1 uncharacterized protein LOC112286871 isoform X1 [Physcomitrella patens]
MRFALWVVLLGSYRVKYCANWMSFHIAASGRASSVASDETIAQTLQEEYDTEAAWEEENASIISTNPLQVPMEAEGDEALDRGRMATSSSLINLIPRNSISSVDGDFELPLILSEDYSHVDKELARRFHELDPIPHSPKVNGVTPSVESANADHHLLLHRLSLYGLTERRIAGDGNCQFRALSDQLYRSPDHHQFVRDKIVSQLTNLVDKYSGYIPMSYNEYLKKMSNNGEWGDHVTLQAAADYYGVKISLVTSFKDRCFIEIMPSTRKSAREIYLSFWAEIHYNSIYPLGGVGSDFRDKLVLL